MVWIPSVPEPLCVCACEYFKDLWDKVDHKEKNIIHQLNKDNEKCHTAYMSSFKLWAKTKLMKIPPKVTDGTA